MWLKIVETAVFQFNQRHYMIYAHIFFWCVQNYTQVARSSITNIKANGLLKTRHCNNFIHLKCASRFVCAYAISHRPQHPIYIYGTNWYSVQLYISFHVSIFYHADVDWPNNKDWKKMKWKKMLRFRISTCVVVYTHTERLQTPDHLPAYFLRTCQSTLNVLYAIAFVRCCFFVLDNLSAFEPLWFLSFYKLSSTGRTIHT